MLRAKKAGEPNTQLDIWKPFTFSVDAYQIKGFNEQKKG